MLDVFLEGGRSFRREGEQQAADLVKSGVVAGLPLEVREQVYRVADRPPHERGGPDLADEPGRLRGSLVEQVGVALQNLPLRTPGPPQVVGNPDLFDETTPQAAGLVGQIRA